MAAQTYSDVSGALMAAYKPVIQKLINTRSVLLSVLPILRGSGKNVTWDAEGSGTVAENFSDGADVANYGFRTLYTPVLTWGLYRSNFSVTKLARDSAGSSPGPEALARLLGRNLTNSVEALVAALNAVGFSGAGTGTTICGLTNAIHDSNTYAGIDRGATAAWRSTVIDPGVATAPTLRLLRSDVSTVYDACGLRPDVAVTTSAIWQKIASLFDDSRRYNVDVIQTAAGEVRLLGGASAIDIDGCKFLADKDATASCIYYLNTSKAHWEYLPNASEGDFSEVSREVSGNDGFGEIPLGMTLEQLAKTGAAAKYTLESTCQLIVDNPVACAKRLNVSST